MISTVASLHLMVVEIMIQDVVMNKTKNLFFYEL